MYMGRILLLSAVYNLITIVEKKVCPNMPKFALHWKKVANWNRTLLAREPVRNGERLSSLLQKLPRMLHKPITGRS